jgi:vancomycin resistance protein YoaR
MVLDAAIFYNKAHAGVTIEGQSVSGLTQDAAVAKIDQFVADSQNNPITLTGGGKTWQVKPTELGTQIDVAAAVAASLDVTRKNNFVVDLVTKLQLYFRSRDLPLQGNVDTASLDTFIERIAADLDKPAVNAELTIRGATVAMLESKDGQVVDREALRQTLTQTLLSLQSTDITIPMAVDKPDVVSEDNEAAMTQAKIMVSAPLTLTWGDKSWSFTPQEIASFIVFTPEDAGGASSSTSTSSSLASPGSTSSTAETTTSSTSTTLTTSASTTPSSAASMPRLSAEKMAPRLQEIGTQTTATPVEASFKIVNNKVQVVPGVEGVVLDPANTAAALTVAALKTTAIERTAEVQGTKQEPELTTAEAEAMGVTDLIATYSDRYVGSQNRQTNVRLTTVYVLRGGKLFLAPGEEFDFKKEVGPRTPERGYVKAPGISPGVVLEDQYGGGICEVSTAVFNAALLAGLKITERTNHSIYFDHYPKGRDATVSDPGPNLRFVNNTDHYIWITGKSDGKTTVINVYGTNDGRKVSLDVSKWYGVWGPYTSTTLDPALRTGVSILVDKGEMAKMCMLTRTVTWPGGKKVKDQFESNYKHRWALIRVGTGATTTTVYTPPPTPTTTTTLPYGP